MKKLLFLSTVALMAVFFSCQKDSLSVMNNAPESFLGTADERGGHGHHGDSTMVCDTVHVHDSLHVHHHDSLHVHDSLHLHLDSLHLHHDTIPHDTTDHGGGHGGHGGGHGHHGHGG